VPLDVLSGGKEFALSVLKDDGYRLQGFSPSIDDIFENLEGRVGAICDSSQVDDIKTAPMDFRFPTTNQAKHCYTRYNEYHK
jgi:hypothetical protein